MSKLLGSVLLFLSFGIQASARPLASEEADLLRSQSHRYWQSLKQDGVKSIGGVKI